MGSTKFPYEFKPAVKTEEYHAKYFKGLNDGGFVEVGPKKYVLSENYAQGAETVYNMPVRPDDTFVVTFPRSGTTWTQELVWLIQSDMDFEKAKSVPLIDRYPFLEHSLLYSESSRKDLLAAATDEKTKKGLFYITTPATEILAKTPSPRFIKTHLPISLLPAKTLDVAKMVYVARDPRDAMVSYYHFTLSKFQGEFKNFFDQFIDNCLMWSPILEHIKEGWELRDHPNVLFLFYEDLIKDMAGSMRRVAQFFGKQYTDEQYAALADHLHIDNFKKNPSVDVQALKDAGLVEGEFVRKGKSEGWKEYLDGNMRARMEQWLEEGLRGSTLRFPKQ